MSQEWSLAGANPAPVRRKGKAAIVTGSVLMAVGVVLAIVGIAGLASSAGGLVSGITAPFVTPASFDRELGAGAYQVYEATGGGPITVTPDLVTVTGPDGSTLPISGRGSVTQTYSDGDSTFVDVARFDVPSTGTYSIAIAGSGATVTILPALTSLGGVAAFGLLVGLAVLLGVIGLVVLIVGLVRRAGSAPARQEVVGYPGGAGAQPYQAYTAEQRIAPQPVEQVQQAPAPQPPVQALPPAGWYPDPGRPGGQRYWDGQQWTEHQA